MSDIWTKLTPRERDAAVATGVMGWSARMLEYERTSDPLTGNTGYFSPDRDDEGGLPHYTTEHAAARLVEDEIERRGLQQRYVDELLTFEREADFSAEWFLIRATPEQRCLAALRALGVAV